MRLLTLSVRDEWLAVWEKTGREPFAHPDYVALFAEDGEAVALHGHGGLLPLVLRDLDGGWRDATSPYGYGGPYGDPDADFYPAVLAWMEQERVVTAFLRVALEQQPPELALSGYARVALRENVVVNVTRPAEEQWRHYEHKVRKNVNKAERAGMTAQVSPEFGDLEGFTRVYLDTMRRRGAEQWYHFGRDFFAAMANLKGSFVVAEVRSREGSLASVELVMQSDRFLYSFLGGTCQEFFADAPNDLLKHAVIAYGRETGREGYVLGGGYTSNDGIFRYKRTFDKEGVRPYFGVQLTGAPEAYRELTALHRSVVGELAPEFFPAYRAPAAVSVSSAS
ncbi:GNAT family N-acetyltransferase [Deinococcus sp. MIMF12]|uniref:GNAT family N-acetyltransferase n=1 Tax=Deinococcus rhizophilus TaxID=3049544 RepID=A0ABT7JEW2_9DEIO|nr:GNAT family N-acetyltransferase [Deinococcus rhizophilus]MDL2343600.1 GNAT family N-acetyltransferase [Deinococcus rhizophilus]